MSRPRLIADINVLVFGMLGKKGALANRFYKAFRIGTIQLVFDQNLANELQMVLDYPAVIAKGVMPSLAFRLARDLYELGEYVPRVTSYDWPSLHDKADWYLLNLSFESASDGLITQDKAILVAGKALGMPVFHLQEGASKGWY